MKNVNEAAIATEEVKLPKPIILKTKDGGAILRVATSIGEHEKRYFKSFNVAKSSLRAHGVEPYKIRKIATLNLDGMLFRRTDKLFAHLIEAHKYQKA